MISDADVVVVGAGTSGAAAAALLAERGMRVICVERRRLDEAGARWVNGVPRAAFATAGIALPDHRELAPTPFHLVTPHARATVMNHDVVDLDMRQLVAHLQERAARAGVELRGEVSVRGRDGDRLETSRGPLRARFLVDASGLAGARLLGQPKVAATDLCAAAQEVREVRDRDTALAFFTARGVPPGEALCFAGIAGGFSVLTVRLHSGGETVSILTGAIPALGFPSGRALLDDFVAGQPWIGARVFGGSGAIPLRRPHDRLADDRVALLGDAGCHVFPAHGSGIGAGLVAARVLADTLGNGGSLRDYEVAWQRRYGGVIAFFDVFRRWNQTIDAATIGRIMGAGLLDASTLRAGLDQTLPRPTWTAARAGLRAVVEMPALTARLATVVARGAAVRALYAAYPRNPAAVPAWSRHVDRAIG